MWKTFAGRCIYQSEDARVLQNPFFRWLQFNSNALQTVLCRFVPHWPQLNYIKYLVFPVQQRPLNCCMLGLGGGGAAHALSPILGDARLIIVEYSAEVIDLCKRYFMIDRLKNVDIVHDEASAYLSRCNREFDYLLIDLYTAHNFPTLCANPEFFARCKEVLKPGGVLAVNLANTQEHLPLFQLIQKQFLRSTVVLPVPGSANIIIFAQNSNTINLFLDTLKKFKKFKQLSWSSQWGYIARVKR